MIRNNKQNISLIINACKLDPCLGKACKFLDYENQVKCILYNEKHVKHILVLEKKKTAKVYPNNRSPGLAGAGQVHHARFTIRVNTAGNVLGIPV